MVSIYGISGEEILSGDFFHGYQSIDLRGLSSGVYILRVSSVNGLYYTKLIKE